MTDQGLIAGLRSCGINPEDAVQVNERANGQPSNYLVFRDAVPYPKPKMHCLARALLRAGYGVRQSSERFEAAYLPAWNAEFAVRMRERAVFWLQEHRKWKSAPPVLREKHALKDFARGLEKFCGVKPGALAVERQSLRIPLPEDEPQSDCLLAAALVANLEKHGFAVQTSGYE